MNSSHIAWLVALLAALFQLSCGEVESCKEAVEPGCLKSAPLNDGGTCLFDLVPRGGVCVKPGSEEDKCSLCAPGDLCIPERNQCQNFCAAPPIFPGSVAPPTPIFCTAFKDPAKPDENPMLSFAEVCTRRCRLQCQRWEQFCGDYRCAEGYCDRPEIQATCLADCKPLETGGNDLACLTRSCTDVRFGICDSSLDCPNAVTPDCTNITCTNSCMYDGKGLAGDGYCDDGDPASAKTADCRWGTDCADCGPRKGTKLEPSYPGDVCGFNNNCVGGTGSPVDSQAWCVALSGVPGLSRCAPDCSRGQACADGFECREAIYRNDQGVLAPIVEGGVSSKACFPSMCL